MKQVNDRMPPSSRPTTASSHRMPSSKMAVSRPGMSRAATIAPSVPRPGPASPTHSVASMPANLKRKERDFDLDGGEETNIHVVVRCRGRNDREVRENSGVVVSTEGTKGKSVELSMGPSALSNKRYHFDRVFSPAADQAMIFDDVVAPILSEMLQGFNCTIFAYGQTGTGKTYTMSGDMSDSLGLLSDSAGIIPRVLNALFKALDGEETVESNVKCSFIELYNEELRDLLSIEEHAKLKIFDGEQKKGHSATIIQGMEESHIRSADDGINLLQAGSHKRQVAATKCNDLSSRSHTVFSITVYIKRVSEGCEDFVSIGKLNLVDLAGSENIQRSGAENKRAAEAGLINKSLLTLGRVINALVDKSSHIPYRESKLTRLLQDSLGGRTKTYIIATVSPAKSNLEETISTLDYAFRAKNIRNKPQTNPMISKRTLLKEFTSEIEKLKSELIATRQRNGVYLSNEQFEEVTVQSESRRILSEEQRATIETKEVNLRNKIQELLNLTTNLTLLKKDNEATVQALDSTKEVLQQTEVILKYAEKNLANETLLRQAHQATEEELSIKGKELLSTLDRTVEDVGGLHAKLRRKSSLQSMNRSNWQSSQQEVSTVTKLVDLQVSEFQHSQKQLVEQLSERVRTLLREELGHLTSQKDAIETASMDRAVLQGELTGQATTAKQEMDTVLEEIKVLRGDVKAKVGEGLKGLSAAASKISAGVISELGQFQSRLHTSYSELGQDIKMTFDNVVEQLNAQKAEADHLQARLAEATATAAKRNREISQRFESTLASERELAAMERTNLISKISTLIDDTGIAQEQRRWTEFGQLRKEMDDAQADLLTANASCSTSFQGLVQRGTSFAVEVLDSRDKIKAKLLTDWNAVNEQNRSIQNTTESVHEETVRIVEAQMADMATQMAVLDDFVTGARSQNESHHCSHLSSLQKLDNSMSTFLTSASTSLNASISTISALKEYTSTHTATLSSSLPTLDLVVREPLTQLRETILSTPLTEYSTTGQTPQKQAYVYPISLPCTLPHDQLLASSITLLDGELALSSAASFDFLSPGAPQPSPSKALVYSDPSTSSGSTTPPLPPPIDQLPTRADPTSLCEIDVNANSGVTRLGRNLDPEAALSKSLRILPKGGDGPGEGARVVEFRKSTSTVMVGVAGSMAPPPLKRVATESNIGAGRGAGGKQTRNVRASGRENALLVGESGKSDGNVPTGRVGRRLLRSSFRGS